VLGVGGELVVDGGVIQRDSQVGLVAQVVDATTLVQSVRPSATEER